MFPAILGGLATGAAGSAIGSLFGGSGPTYEPSPTMQALSEYGQKQVKASKTRREAILSQARALQQGGNFGAAESFLESYLDRYSNPKFIEKELAKSYKRPVRYDEGGFWDVANTLYGGQGLGFTAEEFGGFAKEAQARGIRSPQAFEDMLKKQLIASGKVMTPQQEQFSNIFGTAARDASGRLTGKYLSDYTPVKPITAF